MKLISKNVHDRLKRAAERSKAKYADKLLTTKVPVSVRILKELKLPVSEGAAKALAEAEAAPWTKGTSCDVASPVKLADYLVALEKYDPTPEPPKAKA